MMMIAFYFIVCESEGVCVRMLVCGGASAIGIRGINATAFVCSIIHNGLAFSFVGAEFWLFFLYGI